MVDILSDFSLPAFFSLAARNLPLIAEEWIYSMHIMLFDTNVHTYKHIQAWHVHIHFISVGACLGLLRLAPITCNLIPRLLKSGLGMRLRSMFQLYALLIHSINYSRHSGHLGMQSTGFHSNTCS